MRPHRQVPIVLLGLVCTFLLSPTTPAGAAQPWEIKGAEMFYAAGSARCAIGFSVAGGYVTAGHCGATGTPVTGYNQAAQGTVASSVFPGRDSAWVRTNSSWLPRPVVRLWGAGGDLPIVGARSPSYGDEVCWSSPSSGVQCTEVLAVHQSVSLPGGTIHDQAEIPGCLAPGESGGPIFTRDGYAVGVISAGTGACGSDARIYFSAIGPILERYGLALLTTS